MIEVYGQPNCVHCEKAVELCKDKKLPYKYFTVKQDITIEEFKEMFPRKLTVPQINVDGQYLGGYDELEAKYEKPL